MLGVAPLLSITMLLLMLMMMMMMVMVNGQSGEDYIDSAPMTVYELSDISAQNMDFDAENNMFVAHSGWYNDKLIHYYKFRMYTPSTYPSVISPGVSSDAIPIQNIYLVTTDGSMDGVVGNPIIQYHTSDGNSYSDFMEINLVTPPPSSGEYQPNAFKSEGDITDSGAQVLDTGIILNIPVVPTAATLQHPITRGTTVAPIDSVPLWYKGVEVRAYVFEVTDQAAADYFAFTRSNPKDSDYSITVTPFASAITVNAIPIWHINQYTRGVSLQDANFGGPSPNGMRNIINLDRLDPGYSPLWQVYWLTELPLNYAADQISNAAHLISQNGFTTFVTPMFVNCPDIGPVGTELNPNIIDANGLTSIIDTVTQSNWILGSHSTLVMRPNINLVLKTFDGVELDTFTTNDMGAYEYEILTQNIPKGTIELQLTRQDNDLLLRTIPIVGVGQDYIQSTPKTVYESIDITPQNMDYDAENNMFVAHSGWYKDKLIHYYKFRMYTPSTYPSIISPGDGSDKVPIQTLFLVIDSTGTTTQVLGNPIIHYHTTDGAVYSDFMRVSIVSVPAGYIVNSLKSEGDVRASGLTVNKTDMIVNMPVVPTESKLQDPITKETNAAPIRPVIVWYRGVEVWTYVFEVTNGILSDFFGSQTRVVNDDLTNSADYAITTTPFASPESVSAIPIWHLNQYTRGVSRTNFGGPSARGMRNIIHLDRPDDGYSPLWQVRWMVQLPINYLADNVSNSNELTESNGFMTAATSMYINCPNIGPVGTQINRNKLSPTESFLTYIDDDASSSNWIIGSDLSLIMQPDVTVTIRTSNGITLGTVATNGMGAYEYELKMGDLPSDDAIEEIEVLVRETVIRTINVGPKKKEEDDSSLSSLLSWSVGGSGSFGCWMIVGIMTLFMVL